MTKKSIVLTGRGLNCERETQASLQASGFEAEIIHIIDLLASPEKLKNVQNLTFVGGFSYGDHGGAALALAEDIRRIENEILSFLERDTTILGTCNGCQLLLRLNMFANTKWGFRANEKGHYECRWVNVKSIQSTAFTKAGEIMPIPVAHGEGRLFGGDKADIALQYVDVNGEVAKGSYPDNPNGAQDDAAGIFAYNGRVLAMMPHPERGYWNWQRPNAHKLRAKARRSAENFDLEAPAPASTIFENLSRYFD